MTIKIRLKFICWLMAAMMLVLSGIPYVSYLYVRNKVLAHHKWTHVSPDDVVLVGWMGVIPKLRDGLNLAVWLDNPGGTVYIPNGSYPVSSLTLKSNINLLGAGKGQADAGPCPTTITTTATSGDMLAIANMTDIHIADICLVNNGAAGTMVAIHLNYGQRSHFDRLYISGPFLVGIQLDTFLTSGGSTIWNTFDSIHITGLAALGIGCELNSHDATNKVINNNYFWNTSCIGGVGGIGLWVTDTAHNQVINENEIHSGELSCLGNSGTAVLIDQGATKDLTFYDPNMEGCSVGFSKRTANSVSVIGGNDSSNGNNSLAVNVVDDQPFFTTWFMTSIGSAVQDFSISPLGDLRANSIGVKAPPDPGNFNMLNGACYEASGTCFMTGNNTGATFSKGIGNAGTGLKHARVTTGNIGATTRADITLSWPGTAFTDTSYTVTCTIGETTVAAGTQSLVLERVHTLNTGNVIVSVFNGTAGGLTGTVNCMAMHD